MFSDDCLYQEFANEYPNDVRITCLLKENGTIPDSPTNDCSGIYNCKFYKQKREESREEPSDATNTLYVKPCIHRALWAPNFCGGPCATAEGYECPGELNCAQYSAGPTLKELLEFTDKLQPTVVTKEQCFDPVEHPSHYTEGREYEPKDVIYDWGLDFNLGSAVKYISRAGRKDDIIQDLKKAQQFIQFEIDAIEKKRGKK